MKYNQTEYNKNWQEKNKERATYLNLRTKARSFIRNKAAQEDLLELKEIIEKKLEEFEKKT